MTLLRVLSAAVYLLGNFEQVRHDFIYLLYALDDWKLDSQERAVVRSAFQHHLRGMGLIAKDR
jgi:hypothetical protein